MSVLYTIIDAPSMVVYVWYVQVSTCTLLIHLLIVTAWLQLAGDQDNFLIWAFTSHIILQSWKQQ